MNIEKQRGRIILQEILQSLERVAWRREKKRGRRRGDGSGGRLREEG